MRILLAIDGSPCSDAAIERVAGWPWQAHSEVRIITVDTPVDPGFLRGVSSGVFDEIIQQQRSESAKRLSNAKAVITKNAPALRVSSSILEGSPKESIVEEAERFGAELIVVGSNGYGSLRRFFLGSVSLFVAQYAPCSVLIVR